MINKTQVFARLVMRVCFCFVSFVPFVLSAVGDSSDSFEHLEFDHLKTEIGVGSVSAMVRDHRGFLWIGSYDLGLMRYDGYEIDQFAHHPEDTESLSAQEVECVFEDSSQRLWVGTRVGLNRYDWQRNSFVRYWHSQGNRRTIADDRVNAIYEDQSKRVWMISSTALNLYSSEGDDFKRYIADDHRSLGHDFTSMVQDQDGHFWVAGTHPGIFKFDPETGVFKFVECLEFGDSSNPKKLFVDSRNTIWIADRGLGLIKFDPEKSTFFRYPVTTSGEGISGQFVWDLVEYPRGQLLLAINQGGLNRLNLDTGEFTYQSSGSGMAHDLSSDGTCSLLADSEGILWVGSSRNGIDYVNKKEHTFNTFRSSVRNSNSLCSDIVGTFLEDSRGWLWVGTDGGGISVFDSQMKFVESILPNTEDGRLHSGVIRAIVEDEDGKIWVATWNDGIVVFKYHDGQILRDTSMDDRLDIFKNQALWSIYIDGRNRLWVSTPVGDLSVYDLSIEPIIDFPARNRFFDHSTMIEELPDGRIIVSSDVNLRVFDEESLGLFELFETPNASVVKYDGKQFFYVGTADHGVRVVDDEGIERNKLSVDSGLSDNYVASIEIAVDGRVWVSTNNGLNVYDPELNAIESFHVGDGLQGNQFFLESSCLRKDGTLCFGGTDGFSTVQPLDMEKNTVLPNVFIQEIHVNNRAIDYRSPEALFHVHPQALDKLELPYDRNFVSFDFGAVSMTHAHKNQYQYRLQGLEEEWVTVGSDRRRVSYTDLDPGNYVFQVRASNNDGVWNEEGVSLRLSILPPFWQTPWFYGLIVGFVLLCIYAYILYREKRFIKDREVLESKIIERTALIEEQKAKLEVQGQELMEHRDHLEDIVRDRTRELFAAKERAERSDKLKSSFLANLSHEIRTPLNAIVGLSGFLSESGLDESEREEFVSAISLNSDSLLRLIEDILDFSMLETGQLSVENEPFELNQTLDKLYASFSTGGFADHVSFSMENSLMDQHLRLETDELRLKQILDNLISNALKFTVEGEVHFGVRREGRYLEIFVKDNGPGIPKSKQKLIFGEFVKLEKDMMSNMRGVGLGLAISKRLSMLLGGELSVESEIGEGTTFTLRFPESIIVGVEKTTQVSRATQTDPQLPWDGLSFLIIEDEYSNFLYLSQALVKGGAQVDHADNGKSGLEMIIHNDYDIVFLDIQMPTMDGYQTLKLIKEMNLKTKVVSQTAFAFPEDRRKIEEAGFDGFLWKPIPIKSLEREIKSILDRRSE